MENKVICAGFGGQGVMSMGQLLAYAGMIEDKYVSWLPSYGPEMRGGTANCGVTVSDEEIGSPIITNDADIAIVMNLPSLIKFEKDVKPGGKIFINSSLIEKKVERTDIEVYYIDANKIAADIGNIKAANLVMLGAVLKSTPIVDIESILEAFKKVFGPSKERFIPQNREALVKGGESI
ncbi:MAG: 2-oxoacid:acceptor oxidoreductase family protein [Proteocatella sp.]|nr:2-oxoacid:acceptor oxidoreductase family protein [Proteocatella sp.]MBP9966437.1 2-oxoacid:acceptor oxidoreductase family protein [Proteocatella sp.]NCB70961.1 2-oxoacid:ferredoxin oxidoreductase subunit gamma [Clostridia bacterium]